MLYSPALRYFVEVVRAGSLGGAAMTLNVAISAISRQIAKLEHEVGAPLFERRPSGMVLTESGELLAEYARRALLEGDAALGELKRADRRGGVTRVGCTEGLARNLVPHALARHAKANAKARFALRVGLYSEVRQWVEQGDVDLGVSFSTGDVGHVHIEFCVDMPVFALVGRDHPLAAHDRLTLYDLAEWPIALLERGNTVRQMFELACATRNLSIEPVFTSNNATAVHAFAARTGAITLASQFALLGLPNEAFLVAKPLAEKEFQERRLQITSMIGRRLPQHVRDCLQCFIALSPINVERKAAS